MKSGRYSELKEGLGLAAGLIMAALLLHVAGIGCPIRYLTGIPCAGCGMTRALVSLGLGHWRAAAGYHPLVFTVPPAFLLWMFRRRLPPRARRLIRQAWWVLPAAFVLVYLVRLATGDPLIRPDLRSGLLWRAAKETGNVLSVLRK